MENTAPRDACQVVLAVATVALFVWWAAAGGGYAPTRWYPGALLVLVAVAVAARPEALRALHRRSRWALAGLAGFTAWSFVSIAWSDQRGTAWDGANRTLLYLTVFVLFATRRWRAREATLVLGAYSIAIAVLGGAVLFGAVGVQDAFMGGRLWPPVGYANGSAALFIIAACPAAVLASRSELPWWLRTLMLGAAGALVQLTILTQSRGALLAIVIGAAAWLALDDRRDRVLATMVPIAAAGAVTLPAALAVYNASRPGRADAVQRERLVFAGSILLLLAAGAVLSRRRARPVHRHRRRAPRALIPGVVVVVVAAAATAGALASHEGRGASDTGRLDFWRVAALEFSHHPLHGVGADTFALDYVRDRRGLEEPLYPHSVVWRTLAQTGLVGAVLMAMFAGGMILVSRRLRPASGLRAAAGGAGVVAAAAWLAQASIDWMWELPAVTAPVMAWLGLAAAPTAPALRRRGDGWRMVAAGAVLAAGAASYLMPLLAARLVEHAARTGDGDPRAALRDLDRARGLNALSPVPDLVAGQIAQRAGDRASARRAFERALAREPRDWYARVQLAVLDLDAGRRQAGLRRLRTADALSPREPSIDAMLRVAGAGATVPADLRRRLAAMAVQGPLHRHTIDCHPLLGIAARCAIGERP